MGLVVGITIVTAQDPIHPASHNALHEVYNNVFRITDPAYGASTALADNVAAIQACINAAGVAYVATGCVQEVRIPIGRFTCLSTLLVPSGVELIAEAHGSILYFPWADVAGLSGYIQSSELGIFGPYNGVAQSHIAIRGLTIRGNGNGTTKGGGFTNVFCGVIFYGVSDVTIDDCQFDHIPGCPIIFHGVSDFDISHNRFHHNGTGDIILASYGYSYNYIVKDGIISRNRSTTQSFDDFVGVFAAGTGNIPNAAPTNISITDNIITGTHRMVVGAGLRDSIVANNVLQGASSLGVDLGMDEISLFRPQNVVVEGNVLRLCGTLSRGIVESPIQSAVRLANCDRITVRGNVIKGSGGNPIDFTTDITEMSISGNVGDGLVEGVFFDFWSAVSGAAYTIPDRHILNSDYYLQVNTTAGDVVITLPTVALARHRVTILRSPSISNILTIQRAGSEFLLVPGSAATSVALVGLYSKIVLEAVNGQWLQINV